MDLVCLPQAFHLLSRMSGRTTKMRKQTFTFCFPSDSRLPFVVDVYPIRENGDFTNRRLVPVSHLWGFVNTLSTSGSDDKRVGIFT